MPVATEFGAFEPVVPDLRGHFRTLKPGRATSVGGCRNEYLSVLAITYDDPLATSALPRAEQLGGLLLSGSLPPWFYATVAASVLVPLAKKDALLEARPICVGDAFRCAVWSWATKASRSQFEDVCWPYATGSGTSGAAALEVHSVRELLDLHPPGWLGLMMCATVTVPFGEGMWHGH